MPKLFKYLYFQVIVAIILGVLLGHFYPDVGINMYPIGEVFIRLIKMLITPIIFCTIVTGIGHIQNVKKIGRVGIKTIIYFEVITTFALVIGLIVMNILQPGAGLEVKITPEDAKKISELTATTGTQSYSSFSTFFVNIIPATLVDAFAKGDILQVLIISVLFGFALSHIGSRGTFLLNVIEQISHVFFGMINIIIKIAPLGAFGAMAFNISKYGLHSLESLGKLIGTFYLTCFIFIFVVLGTVAKFSGFHVWKLIRYIKEEIFIVLGTSSSETVLPRVITKLENLGCSKSTVGLVIPTGYSFNLDGTSIYLTMAALFVAQATNTPLSFTQQLTMLGIFLFVSKGAAGVTGAGFVMLASAISYFPQIPIEGIGLILGIDRFMSEGRSITNLIGNVIGTVIISKWENELDAEKMQQVLNNNNELETVPLG